MHITIRSRRMTSGSVDELMRKLAQGFMPLISAAPGYVTYYVIDSGDGMVSAISIFEDEATALASNQLAEASFSLAKSPVNLMGMDTKAKTTTPIKLHRFSSSLFRISAAPSKRLTKSVPRTGT